MENTSVTSPSESHRRHSEQASTSRDMALFMRWRRDRDGAAREELISRYASLARRLARRYLNTSELYEDLYQVAQLGLVKAVDGYDPDRGFPFTAYAVPTILGELRRHFRSSSWSAHVPRAAQERALEVRDAERALAEQNGRSPSVSELAQFMELSIDDVLDGMQALSALGSISLDAPRHGEAGEDEVPYAETLGDEDPRYELVEMDMDLAAALRVLEPRQREILRLRFVEELSQSQIAERVGVSQMQISRLLARCVAHLREITQASTRQPAA